MSKKQSNDHAQGKLFDGEVRAASCSRASASATVLSFLNARRERSVVSDSRLVKEVLEHARKIK